MVAVVNGDYIVEKQIEYLANDFIRALQAMPQVNEYIEAYYNFINDTEIVALTEKYNLLSVEFREKQYEGTLTQEEISELRMLTSEIHGNIINIKYAEKQNNLKIILRECNVSISNEISMDFAKLAAPSTC